ncbi:Hsp70 family protein [Devosia sediminis]|uniref:Hsp70 family protein n=1 Tax=Devosia sediminis TaxID=2798801 RepID=A0A934IT99_9HYPH|nr:Hsp70 family protein [Devosia sediminis]MBJ3786354.1 Hsp70 family protein [Devosia sediminis]
MFLGIDLGTSNSAIVGSDGETLKLFKTVEGMDVMPSAIMVDRRGGLFVGRKAYDQSAFSPQSVQQKFKRLMGTASVIEFPGTERALTPEEASAEVIKSLVAQARRDLPDLKIEGTVITIPAAFNQMQSEATMRAARLAGLDKVALLQEPIAAAMSANAGIGGGSGQFLVYDLGGGTFDAAIVQGISGNITIVAHAGVNMLGGADFDRAIVNNLVRPWLLKTFDLPENFQADPRYSRLIRIASYRAELCKIALSSQHTDFVSADETQVGTKDQSGNDIYLDVEVTRSILEELISENVERSIAECRTLLSSNGYSPGDMDSIVMIGGPSRMPYVREQVAFELGISLDTKIDPMTAVATGAAIFASGRSWSDDGATTSRTGRTSKVTSSPLRLRYEYVDNTAAAATTLKIKSDTPPPPGLHVQVEASNGWTSGKLPLTATVDVKGVPLPRTGANDVRVSVFGVDGMLDSQASTTLQINRLTATADGMPLMHNLAIKLVKGGPGGEQNVLHTIAKKGSPTPARGMESFRASRDLRAGEKSSLVFELFEQADGVDDPALNLAVGSFELKGDGLAPGQIIRKGDRVNVHWSIDENSLLHCHFEMPDIGLYHSLENMYVPSAFNFDGEDGAMLAREGIDEARKDLEQLERALGNRIGGQSSALRGKLEAQETAVSLSPEADTRRMVTQETRFIRQEIHRLRHHPANVAAVMQMEIDDFENHYTRYFAAEVEPATNTNIGRQLASARDDLRRNDFQGSRHALEEASAMLNAFLLKQPAFWVARYENLVDARFNAIDKGLHDRLAERGEKAIRNNDVDDLRKVVFELYQNSIRDSGEGDTGILSGLMR